MAANTTRPESADVVVTAIVSTTALAPDAEDTWQQLLAGHCGIRELKKGLAGANRR
jgi:beta-ketoacyl ACP synthase